MPLLIGFESVYLCDAWDNGAFLLEPATDHRSVLILQYATEEAWTPHLSERWSWSRDEDLLLKEPHHYKNIPLCVLFNARFRSCLAMSESYIHINEKPVWTVRFPKAPVGVQDFEVRQLEMAPTPDSSPRSLKLGRSRILTRRSSQLTITNS
jgi:hypothetical protein